MKLKEILPLSAVALAATVAISAVLSALAGTNTTNAVRAPMASPSAQLDGTNANPMPHGPQKLQSAAMAAKPAAPVINPQVAFLEGARIGAMLGRRNPDLDDQMLAALANRIWQQQTQAQKP
jgi:hypothetical protein